MFILGKRSIEGCGILKGATDYHTHILWGVDDGFHRKSHSIEAIRRMKEWGVKELWLTPHIMKDYPNMTSDLIKKFEELKSEVEGIKLCLGAEYMLDENFRHRLADNDILTTNGYVLIETSTAYAPIGLQERIFEVMEKGYHPMLAHPERYIYLQPEFFEMLFENDIRMQLNYTAFLGIYGKEAEIRAKWFLEKGYYKCMGSDLHRLGIADMIQKKKCIGNKTYRRLLGLVRQTNE